MPTDPSAPPLPTLESAIRLAELRRLQRDIRAWSVSQMIWPTIEEVLALIDTRCDQLQVRMQSGALRVREEEGQGEQQTDHGAELIGQPIPDVEGTEPRLNKERCICAAVLLPDGRKRSDRSPDRAQRLNACSYSRGDQDGEDEATRDRFVLWPRRLDGGSIGRGLPRGWLRH